MGSIIQTKESYTEVSMGFMSFNRTQLLKFHVLFLAMKIIDDPTLSLIVICRDSDDLNLLS